MDTQDPKEQQDKHFYHYHHRRGLFSALVGIVLLVIVFCIGLAAGSHVRNWRRISPGYNMMGYSRDGGFDQRGMMGGIYGYQNNKVFGTITGISGNKITINNNAGQAQVIVTQANTAIISATGTQMVLGDLKNGQKISVVGTADQNNQVTATVINVQP